MHITVTFQGSKWLLSLPSFTEVTSQSVLENRCHTAPQCTAWHTTSQKSVGLICPVTEDFLLANLCLNDSNHKWDFGWIMGKIVDLSWHEIRVMVACRSCCWSWGCGIPLLWLVPTVTRPVCGTPLMWQTCMDWCTHVCQQNLASSTLKLRAIFELQGAIKGTAC